MPLLRIVPVLALTLFLSFESRVAAAENSVEPPAPRTLRRPYLRAAPRAEQADRERDAGGIFGPVRIGPLVGASLPRAVSLELMLKVQSTFSVGVEYSFTPPLTVDTGTARASAIAGDVRWFVLGSPFFLGLGVGVQSLSASATVASIDVSAQASKVFVTPRMGVLWTFGPGFSVGVDAGVELPVAHHETVVPDVAGIRTNDTFILLTRRPVPDVHIARLGWLF